jgi:hypothetical protein
MTEELSKKASAFYTKLANALVEHRKISPSTASKYIQYLRLLNQNNFINLRWLNDFDTIHSRLASYAPSTQKTILASIVSILSLFTHSPIYKTLYEHYQDMLVSSKKAFEASKESNSKSITQSKNWIDWDDVLAKRDELAKLVDDFKDNKELSAEQYTTLLHFLILSLYTDIPPRRNQDYQSMVVTRTWNKDMPDDVNYYSISNHSFIFNRYKTASTYGRQIISLNKDNPLIDTINLYLKHHPVLRGKLNTVNVSFLVTHDNKPLSNINSITRILNSIFDKHIGSSMLRSIYLTDKFADNLKSMKHTAYGMGHSVSEASSTYIKLD